MKYKILESYPGVFMGKTLYRIQALKDFSDVKEGDLGGYVENGWNLNQDGNCWIYDEARVFGSAWVSGSAKIYGQAWISENSRIYGNSIVVDIKELTEGVYSNTLIIPKDHPDFWDYRLEYPDLEVIYLDK